MAGPREVDDESWQVRENVCCTSNVYPNRAMILSNEMDGASNAEGKSRPGLGPRLKSYLSSSNLFGLGFPSDSDHETNNDTDWPALDPVYDETTITGSQPLDRWVAALRYRLREYNDVPLDTRYHTSLVWVIDQYVGLLEENKQLKAELLELSGQREELVQTKPQSSGSLHRPSASCPNIAPNEENGSAQQGFNKPRSISFLDETVRSSAIESAREDTARKATSGPGTRRYSASPSRHDSRQRRMDGTEDRDVSSHRSTMLFRSMIPNLQMCDEDDSDQPGASDHLQILSPISERSVRSHEIRSKSSLSYRNLQSPEDQEEAQTPQLERSKSSGSLPVSTRRVFSFCPGDDKDLLESFAKYYQQELPLPHDLDQQLEISTLEGDEAKSEPHRPHSADDDVSVFRGTSTSSVVTVVKTPGKGTGKGKEKAVTKIPHSKPKNLQQRNKSRQGNQANVPADRSHGPIAAAIAATARFGKGGKKTTRMVTPDLQQ